MQRSVKSIYHYKNAYQNNLSPHMNVKARKSQRTSDTVDSEKTSSLPAALRLKHIIVIIIYGW